ncbi:hypothetical protein Goshw_006233 [Gossypium schwendimanii]|uniref:Uncharacterized protein n=1 Tax=Gossypium schwendimanii TaxID=34291 RepID=A0A7J9LKZ0_GOSSC|nr:hypothetical protein [Gossypium schwendimanii]
MALYKKVGVPMTSTEQPLKPSRNIIEDTLFQQYTEMYNNIWVPNYTPDMFGPTNMEQEEEAHESEEEGENKEDDGSKEIDFKEGD